MLKPQPGGRVLDLTCGLGVDTLHFARKAAAVVSLEPDVALHRVSRYNLDRLGFRDIELRCERAEDFVANYDGAPFDLIYVDPSRRGQDNERLHDLIDGQPNVRAMLPDLKRLGQYLLIKAAPGYDIQAGIRLLPGLIRVTVVSLRNECKELWFHVDLHAETAVEPELKILASRVEGLHQRLLPVKHPDWQATMPPLQEGSYLLEPDVAYYKAQRLDTWLSQEILAQHPLGFLWAAQAPKDFPGRVFEVRAVWPYQPKALKRQLKSAGISRANITRRAFPLTVKDIRKRLRLADGGDHYLLLTTWNGQKTVVWTRLITRK